MTAIVFTKKVLLQGTLGGRHHTRHPRIALERHAKGAAKRLENGLNLVVRVAATQVIDVQGYLCVVDESLEKLAEQIFTEALRRFRMRRSLSPRKEQ